ncbi:PepSY-associated TM helix domain-containing protein [Cognatilysobacter segetis]|uniref:PepSY-associated TM helix domain-containing protein n=1 Tax=Cognatilysobacter segetis TaxID=2492394 RepID=UPI00138FBAE1|nr:PepSY-associated TM helix domain-containing protein [Lysobacter segetis]
MATTTAATRPAARVRAHRWIRQLHLWIGAWGALAALLFGTTGLLMNHRSGDNPWPQGSAEESAPLTLAVPESARGSREALRDWLRDAYRLEATSMRGGKPEGGRVGGREVRQPAKWSLGGGTARRTWSLDYVPGNATAELKRTVQSPLAALLRMHKGVGGGLAWRLLQDSFAIGMVLLGLSGLWLWARGRTPRQMVFSVMGLSTLLFATILGLAVA